MKKSKKIIVFFVSAVLLLTTILAPATSASTAFATEAKVQKALYALAAYDCISRNSLQDTAIGNKIDSIIPQLGSSKVYVGQWLGDEKGMITCETAFAKSLGTGKITEDMLNSGKIFNGVYEKDASVERKIKCSYGIINSSATATINGSFSWPQGYFNDAYGNIQDKRTHGVIEVVFNEDGPIRLEGDTSDINVNHTLDSMKNFSIDWSQDDKICQKLVQYTDVYETPGVNAYGESTTAYMPVLSTTDNAPFNEWLPGTIKDYNKAWLSSNSDKFKSSVTSVSTSTRLKLKKDKEAAKSKLLSNLVAIYANGKTNAKDFLDSDADAKYIAYGRYLFNGDGKASYACNGTSILADDPNLNNLNVADYWDISQPYVVEVNAYKNGSASSKTGYLTKFGGNGISEAGSARSITFPGVEGDCKALAREFNNINPTASSAKLLVSTFIKAAAVEDLPDNNDVGTTGGGSADNTPSSGGGSNNGSSGGTDSELADCLNGASSLGWILCPVLNIVGKTIEAVYDDIEENWLPIESNLIGTTSGIYDAWKVFRDFANIVFVVMLIIIVLSQITGFGISNYGIKKMLPSLIIVAVLVNVSYLLCQLSVDIINVVGAEVGGIFSRIGSSGGTSITGGTVVKGAIATVFSFAGITGIGLIAGYTIVTNPGLLVPILIFGIGIIITLFFFYAILAVRKAGIYAMIILSPLAIICYALPNTKSFFDRWKKLFMALLTVYPICQIVTGGGQMISSLMLSSNQGGFVYNVVAIILSFAPIFLIPSLVKGSLAGLGNIGAKISQTGTKLRGLATNKLGNSDAAKRLRTTGAYIGATQGRELMNKVNDKLRKAKVIGGLVSEVEDSRLGKMIGKQNARRDAQAKVAYRKMLMDDAGAANISNTMTGDTIENDLAAQEAKYQQEMINTTAESILNGKGKYTDTSGTETKINASSLDSLTSAWESYMNQYDATGDKSALLNAQALTQLMFDNHGDKGRTAIMDKLKERTFNPISGIGTRTQSFDDLSQFINRNGKWMDKLKGADTGSYKMIGDAASGNALGNLHAYNTAAHDKLTAGNVNELGDSFFHGVLESDKQGVFDPRSANFDQTRFDELTKIRDTFARTMSDPRTAEKIKPDMLREMNKINLIVYRGKYKQAFDKAYAKWQADGHAGGSIADFNNDYRTSHGGRGFGEDYGDDVGRYKELTPP